MASKSKRSSTKTRPKKPDAIALLKADHRQVEEWFSKFENARSSQAGGMFAEAKKSDMDLQALGEQLLAPEHIRPCLHIDCSRRPA